MANLNKTLHLYLSTLPALENKDIVVGFSGGADSTALLHTLIDKQKFFKFNLSAVFFSHGNNPIAQDEDKMAQFCRDFCQKNTINLITVDLDLVKTPRQGWESSGRQARLNFYKDIKADYIFLGHHLDDQNETTMTQLFRGAGRATAGMKKIDGIYCRPFLEHEKKDIYTYLIKHNLEWVEDPTNTNTHFTRNFWRQEGLPTIEKHYPQYTKSLDNFRRKYNEFYDLAHDLAINDGLNNLVAGQTILLDNFSDTRIKNLISHYYQTHHITAEDSFYEQQVAHYRANNKVDICLKNENLYLSKGKMSNCIVLDKKLKI